MTWRARLVVGYDGSDGAKAALAEAVRLAQATGERLAVVFGYLPTQRAGEAADLHRAIEAIGKDHLDEALATVAAGWRPRRCWSPSGAPTPCSR